MEKKTFTAICASCNKKIVIAESEEELQRIERIKCQYCGKVLTLKSNSKKNKSDQKLSGTVFIGNLNEEASAMLLNQKKECLFTIVPNKKTFGRKASDRTVDYPIETGDRRMSRYHANINSKIIKTKEFRVSMECIHESGMIINGNEYKAGEEVVLSDGDIIKIGVENEFIFWKSKDFS